MDVSVNVYVCKWVLGYGCEVGCEYLHMLVCGNKRKGGRKNRWRNRLSFPFFRNPNIFFGSSLRP